MTILLWRKRRNGERSRECFWSTREVRRSYVTIDIWGSTWGSNDPTKSIGHSWYSWYSWYILGILDILGIKYVSISFGADDLDYFDPYDPYRRQVGTEALSSLGRGMEAFSKQAQAQAAAHMWAAQNQNAVNTWWLSKDLLKRLYTWDAKKWDFYSGFSKVKFQDVPNSKHFNSCHGTTGTQERSLRGRKSQGSHTRCTRGPPGSFRIPWAVAAATHRN